MNTKIVHGKHRFWIGFIAGMMAGAIATGMMLLFATAFGGISLPDVVGSALILLLPPSWFEYVHEVIGADAKHYLFYGIVTGQCLVFALSGALYYPTRCTTSCEVYDRRDNRRDRSNHLALAGKRG